MRTMTRPKIHLPPPPLPKYLEYDDSHEEPLKMLLFGTMYLGNADSFHHVNLWIEMANRSKLDWVLIDSASPPDFVSQLTCQNYYMTEYDDIFNYQITDKQSIVSFKNNIGHLGSTGIDGWGRAFSQGLNLAIFNHYDYVVHIESDMLFKPNIRAVLHHMHKTKQPIISVEDKVNHWLETAIMSMSVPFVRDFQLIEKYSWRQRTKEPEPEYILKDMLGGHVQYEKWLGFRNDFDQVNYNNISTLHYLTHCSLELARHFWKIN